MIKLWDDTEIVRDDTQKSKGRIYKYRNSEYPSVTNLLNQIQPKEFLIQWKDRVGEVEAKRISKEASQHGSAVHCAIEAYLRCNKNEQQAIQYFLRNVEADWLHDNPEVLRSPEVALLQFSNLVKPFLPFLALVQPIGIEKPIVWASECKTIGFGGTTDAFLSVDTSKLVLGDGTKIRGNSLVVCDWKNFRKAKQPIATNFKGESYYPLISYCLQLAAYTAAFNQITDRQHRLNQALLVCAHTNCRAVNIYYLSPKAICWYWTKFKEALWCLHHNEYFDWIEFCALTEEQNYLGKKVKIISK